MLMHTHSPHTILQEIDFSANSIDNPSSVANTEFEINFAFGAQKIHLELVFYNNCQMGIPSLI